ncbi:MAG: hypothetical protein KAX88_01370 [Rhodoferax sp.]|jgi:hypothetical protein|nr:hypothetical protein [Rhodoferax sp.]
MNTHDDLPADDDEFEDFLQGRGELAQLLQRLPQPEPPPALHEAILADARKTIHRATPANEPLILGPKLVQSSSPFRRPSLLAFALAASVVMVVGSLVKWGGRSSDSIPGEVLSVHFPKPASTSAPEVPQVPPAQQEPKVALLPPPPPKGTPAKRAHDAPHIEVVPAPQQETVVVAQADISKSLPQERELEWMTQRETQSRSSPERARSAPEERHPVGSDSPVHESAPSAVRSTMSSPVAPAPVAVQPPAAVIRPPPVVAVIPVPSPVGPESVKANAWLKLIDELIKAGAQREALDEWEKFNRAYPLYSLPADLKTKIQKLKN